MIFLDCNEKNKLVRKRFQYSRLEIIYTCKVQNQSVY